MRGLLLRWRLIAFYMALAGLPALLLVGCGSSEPGLPVENPRAYLIEVLGEQTFRGWWAPYADRSDAFLATVVDSLAESLPDGLPADSKRLQRLVPRLLGRYRNMLLSEPYRDHILQSAQARYHNPPMALMEKGVALLDFHYLPGEWGRVGRGYEVPKNPPAIERLGFFAHDSFVAALNRLVKAYPDARYYQIRARYYRGGRSHALLMQLSRNGQILRRADSHLYYVTEDIDWQQLLAGDIRLPELHWSGLFQDDPPPNLIRVSNKPLPNL